MRAKKSLSQCFLVSPSIGKKIVEELHLKETDFVIEVGPGKGAITKYIYQKPFARYLLIEKDRRFIPVLQEHFPKADVLEEDVLKMNFSGLKEKKAKLVSNLPYHITKPFLLLLLEQRESLEESYLLLQKEVVDKIATPTSLLGALFSFFSKVTPLFFVAKNHFHPKPKVDSALVKIHFEDKGHRIKEVQDFLQNLFSSKRKTLFNNLQKIVSKEQLTAIFHKLDMNLHLRVENLTQDSLEALYHQLKKLFK